MANSIAFSVGSGSGGSIIKSIQRGESPIYTIHGTTDIESSKVVFALNKQASMTQIHVPISTVDPSKSIILLQNTSAIFPAIGMYDSDVIPHITISEFEPDYFTCKAVFEYWDNGYDSLSSPSTSTVYSMTGYWNVADINKYKDPSYAITDGSLKSLVDLGYWMNNFYEGGVKAGVKVNVPSQFWKVSYQIIEFY